MTKAKNSKPKLAMEEVLTARVSKTLTEFVKAMNMVSKAGFRADVHWLTNGKTLAATFTVARPVDIQ